MEVSFIIPLYNCLPLTQECLRTLQATLPVGLAHEIILVDDGSTDGTREWTGTLGAACRVYLNETNLGFAATCNRGAAAAQGDILFFLNNDLVFQPGWLGPMHRLVRRHDAGLVGNIQLNATTGAIDHAGLWFNRKGKPEHSTTTSWLARLTGSHEVPALTGACFAIKKSVWHRLGGFDEGFSNGSEDVDLCFKAHQAGLCNRVATRSVVRHHISQAPGRKLRDEENSRRLLARWRKVIAPWIAHFYCAEFLEVSWDEPRNYPDQPLACDAFFHHWGLAPWPSRRLAAAADDMLEIEFRHWCYVLDGASPPPSNRELIWQLRRLPPPPQLVL